MKFASFDHFFAVLKKYYIDYQEPDSAQQQQQQQQQGGQGGAGACCASVYGCVCIYVRACVRTCGSAWSACVSAWVRVMLVRCVCVCARCCIKLLT